MLSEQYIILPLQKNHTKSLCVCICVKETVFVYGYMEKSAGGNPLSELVANFSFPSVGDGLG